MPSISIYIFLQAFLLPTPKQEEKYKEFLLVEMNIFIFLESTKPGEKKNQSTWVVQEWKVKTPQFSDNDHRLKTWGGFDVRCQV